MSMLDVVPHDAELRSAWAEAITRAAIARQIKALRINAGWTQDQLAKALGTKPSGVARLERLTNSPSVKTLQKIADIFDCALIVRFETWTGWLLWIIDSSGERVVPFSQDELK